MGIKSEPFMQWIATPGATIIEAHAGEFCATEECIAILVNPGGLYRYLNGFGDVKALAEGSKICWTQ